MNDEFSNIQIKKPKNVNDTKEFNRIMKIMKKIFDYNNKNKEMI